MSDNCGDLRIYTELQYARANRNLPTWYILGNCKIATAAQSRFEQTHYVHNRSIIARLGVSRGQIRSTRFYIFSPRGFIFPEGITSGNRLLTSCDQARHRRCVGSRPHLLHVYQVYVHIILHECKHSYSSFARCTRSYNTKECMPVRARTTIY